MQVDGFDVVHDHAGIVGPICGAMLQGRRRWSTCCDGRGHRRRGSSTASSVTHVHLVAISDANAPTTPMCRTSAPCTTASTSTSYPYREKKDDVLVYIGRSNPDKGPKEAINIVLPVPACRCRCSSSAASQPEREYFEHDIEPLLASDIELHENVSHEKKVDMLGRACAMIFPIRWPEPFGLVMVEAMACGTPVVTTNWGAAPELVDDGVTGFRRDGDDDLRRRDRRGRAALARGVPETGRGALLGPGHGPGLRGRVRNGVGPRRRSLEKFWRTRISTTAVVLLQ